MFNIYKEVLLLILLAACITFMVTRFETTATINIIDKNFCIGELKFSVVYTDRDMLNAVMWVNHSAETDEGAYEIIKPKSNFIIDLRE